MAFTLVAVAIIVEARYSPDLTREDEDPDAVTVQKVKASVPEMR